MPFSALGRLKTFLCASQETHTACQELGLLYEAHLINNRIYTFTIKCRLSDNALSNLNVRFMVIGINVIYSHDALNTISVLTSD